MHGQPFPCERMRRALTSKMLTRQKTYARVSRLSWLTLVHKVVQADEYVQTRVSSAAVRSDWTPVFRGHTVFCMDRRTFTRLSALALAAGRASWAAQGAQRDGPVGFA